MNIWTKLSIDFANQRNYLDELYTVYPTIPDQIRSINEIVFSKVETAFSCRNNEELIQTLLALDLFPIKDSYISFLRRDLSSINRNPKTVNRICSRLYEMGLDEIWKQCSVPKETNRQIGPLFRNWLRKGSLGIPLLQENEFANTKTDAILDAPDSVLALFAKRHLDYKGTKGLDFVARMNKKYIIGEAKFLTDFGGHQNAQFEDAKAILKNLSKKSIKIAILDGVLYLHGKNKMRLFLDSHHERYNILSSLLLRAFIYQI